jgi:hypothetical protein
VTRAALALAACLAACSGRPYVCQIDGVDVYDLTAPARVGRLRLVRLEAYLESDGGRALVLGCEAAR